MNISRVFKKFVFLIVFLLVLYSFNVSAQADSVRIWGYCDGALCSGNVFDRTCSNVDVCEQSDYVAANYCQYEGDYYFDAESSCTVGTTYPPSAGTGCTSVPCYVFNINWDLNQADCECYMGVGNWLVKTGGIGDGDCCGDDAGEYYCGAGYSACVDATMSSDGDYDLYVCECGELLVQGDCNDGETGCWVPAVSECCGDDGITDDFCDGVIGACSGGIYLTEPDAGAYVCECMIGVGRWNVGGEIDATVCCGDDGEYYEYKMGDTSNQFSIAWGDDPTDDACCDADEDCVFNDVCYGINELASGFNPFGDDNIAECYLSSKWADVDGDFSLCEQDYGLSWVVAGESSFDGVGEYFSSLDGGDGTLECCGDDYEEYNRSRIAGVDSTLTTDLLDIVCCNVGNKCVNDSICYSSGDIIGEQYSENYCSALGIWEGGDASENNCDQITGVGNWYSGLSFELGTGDCCGDDYGETYRTMQCAAGVCIPPALPDGACCDTAVDCVYNSNCYTNVLDGDCLGSSNTCVDVGDGSDDLEVCTSAGWQDPDVNWEACDEVDGYPRETEWMVNGVCGARELGVGDCDDVDPGDLSFCCGDDLGEIVKAGIENICFYDPMQCYIDGEYYNEGEWKDDNYCERGVITSRTKLVALQLLDVADKVSPTDYTLFCDNYQDAVNYYGYEVFGVSAIQYLSQTNKICVLKLPDKVIFGAALNEPISWGTPPFILSLVDNIVYCDDVMDDPEDNDGQFHSCDGLDIWYNNKTQSVIYSDRDIVLSTITFWDKFVYFLKNPFETIINFLFNLFEQGVTQSGDYEFINSTAKFSRIYLDRKSNRFIHGIAEKIEQPRSGEYISVTYSGYTGDICATVNMTDQAFRSKTTRDLAVCYYDYSSGNYYVASNYSGGLALWPELTAGLRTS